MRKILRRYIGWTFPCEKDHLAFKDENEYFSTAYRSSLHKIKKHLGMCPCCKECEPIKVEVLIRAVK